MLILTETMKVCEERRVAVKVRSLLTERMICWLSLLFVSFFLR